MKDDAVYPVGASSVWGRSPVKVRRRMAMFNTESLVHPSDPFALYIGFP